VGTTAPSAILTGTRRAVRIVLQVLAVVAFITILLVRHGPPSGGDTPSITAPSVALAQGHLQAAATAAVLPSPPGYALLTAAAIFAFRPLIGESTWCTPPAAMPRRATPDPFPSAAERAGECGAFATSSSTGEGAGPLPPWYRSQATVAILAWVVMALGAISLLRAAGIEPGWPEIGLTWAMAILPAASNSIVQLFHPQDLLCLGLALAALAEVLRRRWVAAGLLFGLAMATKQFAILILIPSLVAVPTWRARGRVLATGAAIAGVIVAPFFAVAPRRTFDDAVGIGAAGAVRGATVIGQLNVSSGVESALARGVPIAFAVLVCLWALRRTRVAELSPVQVIGLVLACLAGRLVFESVIIPYYLLATSVVILVLDLAGRRLPSRSLAWIACSAAFVAVDPRRAWLDAAVTLALALIAVAIGLHDYCAGSPGAASSELDASPMTRIA